MAKLKDLTQEIKDENDYDGVLFICTKGDTIANLGFAGSMPLESSQEQGMGQKQFVFKLLMEASHAVAFGEPKTQAPS